MAHAAAHPIPKHRRLKPRPKLDQPLSARKFREHVEQIVEKLVDLLDQRDGDENLEDNADKEPSLLGHGSYEYDAELDEGEDDIDLG